MIGAGGVCGQFAFLPFIMVVFSLLPERGTFHGLLIGGDTTPPRFFAENEGGPQYIMTTACE
jgi:hypothetical protein